MKVEKNQNMSQVEPSSGYSTPSPDDPDVYQKQGTSKLRQKPFVVLVKAANIFDTVEHHCKTFNAEAECEPLPIVIDTAISKDVRVHHTATEDFKPRIVKFSQVWNENIRFKTRLREREKARS